MKNQSGQIGSNVGHSAVQGFTRPEVEKLGHVGLLAFLTKHGYNQAEIKKDKTDEAIHVSVNGQNYSAAYLSYSTFQSDCKILGL